MRFGSIGNALVSIPAIRAVRKGMPGAFLALLCDPRTYELWKDCPFLDQVMVYDQKNQNQAGPGYLKMILELRRLKFTHSIHFRRFIRSELIGFLAGAKARIGFDPKGFSLLTRKVPYREDESLVEQNLRLAAELGIKAEDAALEYWPGPPSERVRELLGRARRPAVILHPFARSEQARRWPRFAELAGRLKADFGGSVILIGQAAEAEPLRMDWPKGWAGAVPAFDLTLPELASLIKSADLLIGNDSGPMHLAVAIGAPTVCIYGPRKGLANNLKRWMPKSEKFRAAFLPEDCGDCSRHPCKPEEMLECCGRITAEEVMAKALELGFGKTS